MKIVNLTPHDITIIDGEHAGSYPSAGLCRVADLGLTGYAQRGYLVGLPEPEEGTIYVVSVIAAEMALTGYRRVDDIRVPGGQVRDDSGRIIGCCGLIGVAEASPAAAELMRLQASRGTTTCPTGR